MGGISCLGSVEGSSTFIRYGGLSGNPSAPTLSTNISGGEFGAFNRDYDFSINVTAVPEPEIYAMMGLGLGLIGWVGRRKKLKEAAAA